MQGGAFSSHLDRMRGLCISRPQSRGSLYTREGHATQAKAWLALYERGPRRKGAALHQQVAASCPHCR